MANTRVWLFDLDNTLHNASAASFRGIDRGMTDYIERELGLGRDEANALRAHYLHRYGATLLGLVRHHGVRAAHFLHDTHRLPGLEDHLHGHPHDFDALTRLPGRKLVLTNAPQAYALRVLRALGIERFFDGDRVGQLLAAAVDDVRRRPGFEIDVAHSAITSTTAL